MAIILNTIINNKLPSLSWGLIFEKSSNRVDMFVGNKVDVFDSGIVEGVWDGAFELYGFDEAEFLLGSGVKLHKSSLSIFTASHVLERIYIYIYIMIQLLLLILYLSPYTLQMIH